MPVLVKCDHMNPGGSIKDRLVKVIAEDAESRRVLRLIMTLIEATASNTGVGLAPVAAARGYGPVCVMPERMSVDKGVALSALGAKVVIAAIAVCPASRRLLDLPTGGALGPGGRRRCTAPGPSRRPRGAPVTSRRRLLRNVRACTPVD